MRGRGFAAAKSSLSFRILSSPKGNDPSNRLFPRRRRQFSIDVRGSDGEHQIGFRRIYTQRASYCPRPHSVRSASRSGFRQKISHLTREF